MPAGGRCGEAVTAELFQFIQEGACERGAYEASAARADIRRLLTRRHVSTVTVGASRLGEIQVLRRMRPAPAATVVASSQPLPMRMIATHCMTPDGPYARSWPRSTSGKRRSRV